MAASAASASASDANTKAARRVVRELAALRATPFAGLRKIADPKSLSVLHFLVDGPIGTPYEGGEYVMEIALPSDFPFAPPSLRCLTPSGRFEVGAKICTTFTAFHKECWSPIYTFESILVSLVSLMADDGDARHVGAVHPLPPEETRRALAAASAAYNASTHAQLFV